jgi:hypothetical protein
MKRSAYPQIITEFGGTPVPLGSPVPAAAPVDTISPLAGNPVDDITTTDAAGPPAGTAAKRRAPKP